MQTRASHNTRTQGSARTSPSISSVNAHTSASARSGLAPGPSYRPRVVSPAISSSSLGNAPTWNTLPRSYNCATGSARAAAWPGGAGGIGVPGLPLAGRLVTLPPSGGILDLRLVIARQPSLGVDLAWDARALYAHVGVDLLGPVGGRVRIANLAAREIATPPPARDMPGFVCTEPGGR